MTKVVVLEELESVVMEYDFVLVLSRPKLLSLKTVHDLSSECSTICNGSLFITRQMQQQPAKYVCMTKTNI